MCDCHQRHAENRSPMSGKSIILDNKCCACSLAPAKKCVKSGMISSHANTTVWDHAGDHVQDLGNDSYSKYIMYTCRDVFINENT